jgi:3-methyladenine DNA glycosylase AlkD
LIHQLFYKEKTDTTLFEAIYMKCRHDTDFFIRKAVGWALRQYSATDPVFVRKFVKKHSIVGLAGKEALRKIGG